MELIQEIKEYIQYIKRNPYVYELQQHAIELFLKFITELPPTQIPLEEQIDYFLTYWLPKYKHYLTENEAYNIVYTMQDLCIYINKKNTLSRIDTAFILERYGQEYIRLYKARKLISQLVGEPIIGTNPIIIDLAAYRIYKEKQLKKDVMSLYEQGIFRVDEVDMEGQVCLNKLNTNRYFKVLFKPSLITLFKKGDILHISLRKKIFFIYWEIHQIKGYYLPNARLYLEKYT